MRRSQTGHGSPKRIYSRDALQSSDSDDSELTDPTRETTVLEEYYAAHGGKEKILEEVQAGLKSKKRGRPGSSTPTATNKRSRKNGDHPGDTTPPATAKQVAWKPPAGSWEDEIDELDACEDEESGKLMVYLTWKDGHKTQHETSVIYKRCPQKVCLALWALPRESRPWCSNSSGPRCFNSMSGMCASSRKIRRRNSTMLCTKSAITCAALTWHFCF